MSRFLNCLAKHLLPKCAGGKGSKNDQKQKSSNTSQDAMPPEPAFRHKDTYRHVKDLQEGNEGQCSVMESQTTGRLFVVKHTRAFNPPSSSNRSNNTIDPCNAGRRQPLPNEARMLLTQLHPHPNIIRCFSVESSPLGPRRHLLFMEYCSGGDLLEQLRRFQDLKMPTPEIFTLHVFVEIAQALAYLHHNLRFDPTTKKYVKGKAKHESIIHGDIKPDNIFLRFPQNRRPKGSMPDIVLADFGMAQLASSSIISVTGTPGYDSPETLAVAKLKYTTPNNNKNKNESAPYNALTPNIMTTKSDIYTFGLVMHLVATRRHFRTCGSGDDYSADWVSGEGEGIRGGVDLVFAGRSGGQAWV